MAIGIGIGIGFKKPFSWASYWTATDEVLFFGEVSKITGGRLYNQKRGATDYLTIGGSVGSYTFQCPNTAPYIAADTDYIWFLPTTAQRTVTQSELISYDLIHTPVKYGDTTPNTLEVICILSSTVTGAKRDRLFRDFHLPVMWDNNLNIYGRLKDNRGAYCNPWYGLLLDGNTVGYFDYLDLTTITKDVNDIVSVWNKKTGIVASDMSIVGSTPIWSPDGITFDGIDDYLRSAAFTWIQPESIYSVFKHVTWTANDRLMGGLVTAGGDLRNAGATPGTIQAFAGTASAATASPVNQFMITREVYNGANSKLIVNNGIPTLGNFGAGNRGGFTLGARGVTSGTVDSFANIMSRYHILRKTADAAPLETAIYNLLSKLNGFTEI